ncbi:MAG: phosphoglucosamine mutase [Albidovulum sp.]|nr:phosphoglucosamine mutase [Albidovulum sp.]MDE0304090.1 phosphoglucosamine mutase [Albidovulum sp.]MDE0533357.1 phosphoglucosamine mutase [Albidovulum sp.]
MNKKYFGTDGIRGKANTDPMTAEVALRIGAAVGTYFSGKRSNNRRVVIGKDTRLSGYMLENALTAGLTSTGMNVLLLGPVPTPAVGFLTRSMRADLGVMITASHNRHEDNGIKFFDSHGYKLSDNAELGIEKIADEAARLAPPGEIGRARRIDDGLGRYAEYVKTTFPRNLRLDGIKIVIDCANGSAYKVAPSVLWELGAELETISAAPNGYNINDNCGSTSTDAARNHVLKSGAHAGICFDGDADRVVIIDEHGEIGDGDQLLALLASRFMASGRLRKNEVVATVMSNFGLEKFLQRRGIKLHRTSVGDRYVAEKMRENELNLGGEQSGHIILSDYMTTGDGLIASLQFLAEMAAKKCAASELLRQFEPVPQINKNVSVRRGFDPLALGKVQQAIEHAKARVGSEGRVLVRKSGTEPVVRIMAECSDLAVLEAVAGEIGFAVASE